MWFWDFYTVFQGVRKNRYQTGASLQPLAVILGEVIRFFRLF